MAEIITTYTIVDNGVWVNTCMSYEDAETFCKDNGISVDGVKLGQPSKFRGYWRAVSDKGDIYISLDGSEFKKVVDPGYITALDKIYELKEDLKELSEINQSLKERAENLKGQIENKRWWQR